jgi:hypothetical protein
MAVAIARTAAPVAGALADGSFLAIYSAQSIGAAAQDRIIAVCVAVEVAVSIDGVALLLDDAVTVVDAFNAIGASFGSLRIAMWMFAVPQSSTAADVFVQYSGAVAAAGNNIAVYRIVGAGASASSIFPTVGSNTSTDMDATVPLTTGSTTIPVNGGMLAAAACATDTVAKTWAQLTEDYDADAGTFRLTAAISTTAGTAARTCTGGTNGEDGVMVWAIFSESRMPEFAMQPLQPPCKRP